MEQKSLLNSVLPVLFAVFCFASKAQTIKRAEYFFDADPGKGNGTYLSVTQAASINQTFTVSLASLTNGPHTFSCRVLDSNGRWSLVATRTFFIIRPTVFSSATKIKRCEYFFDHDPGTGQAAPLAVTSSLSESNTFILDISALSSGFHQLSIRYQDDLERWSLFANRTFYVVPIVNTTPSTALKKAEYFFDHDPGVGNGNSLPITSSANQNNLFTIGINSLSPGFHQLGIRYQDNLGHWALFTNRTFYIVPPANLNLAASIKQAEYFFDHDPGTGNGSPFTISSASTQNNTFSIDISSLSAGFHQLAIRYKDNLNRWSSFTQRTFYVFSGSQVPSSLSKLEYFIDSDPGFDKGINLPFAQASVVNQQFNIDLTNVSQGSHTLYVRAKDSKGYWSYVASGTFTILNCIPPSAPIVPAVSECVPGSVNLIASGASGTQVYRWYADATTTSISYTGATFTTPVIKTTTTFYASIYDPTTTCESSRKPVVAAVVNLPKPALNLSGSLAVCSGNSVLLSAPAGFANYQWSNGLTTQEILVSTSGNYSVTVNDGTCTSPSSDPFAFAINPLPPKPTIAATGGGTLCGTGSVSLSAPLGYSTYSWSDGENKSTISVNSPGDFFVMVTDVNGCQSLPSDVFTVLTSIPAKPLVTTSGNTSLCDGSTVDLVAPAGFSNYKWSNGATTPTITVKDAASYSVVVSNGSCSSPSSDPVVVTTFASPSKPAINATGSNVLCNNSFVGLAAPTGFSFYVWSDLETSRQIVVSSAGNYSVQVGNSLTCLSVASDPVAVSLSGQPCTTGGNTANTPPKIAEATIEIPVQTEKIVDVRSLITIGTVGVDYNTLRVTQDPPSGGKAFIDANFNLVLDYTSLQFVGKEIVGIQVCDSLNSCTQQSLNVDVIASIQAYNAISSEQDGKNDFFYLKYVDQIDDTKRNTVVIVDRWGNQVFSIQDYNNIDRVFRGQDNSGSELPTGIYFYRIDFASGRETQTGFISIKR